MNHGCGRKRRTCAGQMSESVKLSGIAVLIAKSQIICKAQHRRFHLDRGFFAAFTYGPALAPAVSADVLTHVSLSAVYVRALSVRMYAADGRQVSEADLPIQFQSSLAVPGPIG